MLSFLDPLDLMLPNHVYIIWLSNILILRYLM